MNKLLLASLMILTSQTIFWFQGNSKILWNHEWSPFKWWLFTGLFTSYMCLWSWWMLVPVIGVWRAAILWGAITILVDCTLNSIFFEYNFKGIVALILVILASALIK
jgi:hypothetical protein